MSPISHDRTQPPKEAWHEFLRGKGAAAGAGLFILAFTEQITSGNFGVRTWLCGAGAVLSAIVAFSHFEQSRQIIQGHYQEDIDQDNTEE